MTVKEFVEKYNQINTKTAKASMIKSILKDVLYLTFEEKVDLSNKIVTISAYKPNTNTINLRSYIKYWLFAQAIVDNYTTLDVDSKNWIEEYNELNRNGVMNAIVNSIPEDEFNELKMVLDMQWNDAITNCNLTVNIVQKVFDNIKDIFNQEEAQKLIAQYLDKKTDVIKNKIKE